MSFVTTQPEALAAAAETLQGIGAIVSAQNAAAAAPTTGVIPAAADEVSALTAAQFAAHAQVYQQVGAQAAASPSGSYQSKYVAQRNDSLAGAASRTSLNRSTGDASGHCQRTLRQQAMILFHNIIHNPDGAPRMARLAAAPPVRGARTKGI
jgi:hypothetical protein